MGLGDKSPLFLNLFVLGCLLLARLRTLPLHGLLGNQVGPDGVRSELGVALDRFILAKNRLVHLFQEQFDLRLTQFHHGALELLVWHPCGFLDICDRDDLVFVEEAQDGGLEHIDDQLVLAGREKSMHFDLPMGEEPSQLATSVGILVPQLEALNARIELLWQLDDGVSHRWPRPTRENLDAKVHSNGRA